METEKQEEHMSGKRVALNIFLVLGGLMLFLFLLKYLLGM